MTSKFLCHVRNPTYPIRMHMAWQRHLHSAPAFEYDLSEGTILRRLAVQQAKKTKGASA